METLLKPARGRLSGAGQGKTEESIRNQRIPPQKTQSFKREKRTQDWFRRPFSGKTMASNDDSDHKPEQVLAVAAATYVITSSIAKPSIQDQKKSSSDLDPSFITDKSRKEDKSSSTSEAGTISEQFSGEGSRKVPATDGNDEKGPKRGPSFRKSLTFADHLGITSLTEPRSSSKLEMLSGPTESTATKPHHPAIKPQTERTKAEAWEKDEMAKIKERYTKLKSTILAWEEKKKKKAKTKLYRAERGLERKRARALLEFQNEMDHIKQAVDGERSQAEANQKANIITVKEGKKKKKAKDKLDRAERGLERKRARASLKFKKEMEYIKQAVEAARAQAEEKQRNDEVRAKEKANIIRTTGDIPRTCICC